MRENKTGRIRCSFDLTEAEAAAICDARCEPKPSTAAAQIVRKFIKESGNADAR